MTYLSHPLTLDVLFNQNPELKPKDDFKQKHPNYRTFSVDPKPPLSEPPHPKQSIPQKDYKQLLRQYLSTYGKPLKPVKQRPNSKKVPPQTICPLCNAPHEYIYYNDGKRMSQLKCKVCNHLFQLNQKFRSTLKPNTIAPTAIMLSLPGKSVRKLLSNDNCPHRLSAVNKLNPSEKALLKQKSSQFKLCRLLLYVL